MMGWSWRSRSPSGSWDTSVTQGWWHMDLCPQHSPGGSRCPPRAPWAGEALLPPELGPALCRTSWGCWETEAGAKGGLRGRILSPFCRGGEQRWVLVGTDHKTRTVPARPVPTGATKGWGWAAGTPRPLPGAAGPSLICLKFTFLLQVLRT